MTTRGIILAAVSIIFLVKFFHWNVMSDIGLSNIRMTSNTDHLREHFTVKSDVPASGVGAEEEELEEFEHCEKMEGQSSTAIELGGDSSKRPVWCMYKDEVALRIIVLTFNRHASLQKLLSSLNDLELDGDSAVVEIWIDRDRKNNTVDDQTVSTARNFRWRQGPVNVHVRSRHVGLYSQWIDTWRPRNASTSEMALFLEDDLSLSPFAYRWLRAARRFYVDRRVDIAGITLQSEGLHLAVPDDMYRPLVRPSADGGAAFLYAKMHPWGLAPTPASWIGFQNWFHEIRLKPGFHPYVPGTIMTKKYKYLEKKGDADSMWSMWFQYYCTVVRQLYTVYNNIPAVAKRLGLQDNDERGCVSVNRREPGLNFRKRVNNTFMLLTTWNDHFILFREDAPVLNFEGRNIKDGQGRP